ncbi:2-dehydropantoate 2-reductase [Enterovibrio nigricans]|uniref:2-dehydropantoate 2-reductase n=1 Tax=Enterovibrio nigricans DSM 22720 TaxID=1121868 RepID=A0A1T4U2V8_9GAMM|nr:2-dehydropantoate 2-reductase [Enterovibrio nigricans]PKF51808.1 2-dehydropantoate 2-reductase [Enterovibrio nigricans]SKA47092.1 2-dehydropantoate 2-reductase [Enterovibrio nigricans DSM 22720]
MRFTIVGAGAVGSLWAIALYKAGHHVHFTTRQPDTQVTRHFVNMPSLLFSANNVENIQDSDCIIVCVKAFQIRDAIHAIKPYLHPDTPVVLMHNGMGSADVALNALPDNPVLLATTSHGSLKVSTETIRHTGFGETRLGGINANGKQCDFLSDVFQHALPSCYWEEAIETALWKKLAVNCMINPLTATLQVQNGVLTQPEHLTQLTALSEEISEVMMAEGLVMTPKEVLNNALTVATATAENYSSMNRDVFYLRFSEIDAITGYLIHRATIHGIAVPENERLYHAIKKLEQSYDHT